ncbi:MAG: hypothetical protein ACRDHZ_03790, partial [Ktedonobacteraceae bacterium]
DHVLHRDEHRPGPPAGVREFDFGLDGERHAMGELLGQLSERSFTQAGLLISVLAQYLTATVTTPGPDSTNSPSARSSSHRAQLPTRN